MGYLRDVVRVTEHILRIDPTRVYVVGFSAGGMMAFRAVCELPRTFAAAGVMSGSLVTPCRSRVRVLHLHGRGDRTVPPAGGYSRFPDFTFPPLATEPKRVPAGSTIRIVLLRLGHEWATQSNSQVSADDLFWLFLSRYRVGV